MIRACKLLGTPYREGGLDPRDGFDCRTLVWYVFGNVLGLPLAGEAWWTGADLGAAQDEAERHLAEHAAQWRAVDRRLVSSALAGDVAHIRLPTQPLDHLAVCVARGRFLTTSRATGVVLVPGLRLRGVRRLFRYAARP